MIDHVELLVAELATASTFFRGALAPLGYAQHVSGVANGFGASESTLDFWLREGGPSTPRPHVAFNCASRELVDAAYAAALHAGGNVRSPPQLMPQVHPSYYAGMVFDPDGHNIEFACHA